MDKEAHIYMLWNIDQPLCNLESCVLLHPTESVGVILTEINQNGEYIYEMSTQGKIKYGIKTNTL